MSKETEKAFRAFAQFQEQHSNEFESTEEMMEVFMRAYNNSIADSTPLYEITDEEKAYEILEELPYCQSEKEVAKILKKALELAPNNLDILGMQLDHNKPTYTQDLKNLVERGENLMREKGYYDANAIGHHWGIIETRPFIRIKKGYVDALKTFGKYELSLQQAKDILRLNENDNLGVRYTVMSLYAFKEQYDEAVAFFNESNDASVYMFLPLILLCIRLDKFDEAKHYYEELQKHNKNCKKVFKATGFNEEKLEKALSESVYARQSEHEIYLAIFENIELFEQNKDEINTFFYKNLVKSESKKTKKKK